MLHERGTVLVVEDQRIYQELIEQILHVGGYETLTADTLAQAERMVGLDFAAITLDLGLPDTERFSALVTLRHLFPRTPIVVVTGTISEQEVMEMIRLGADSCIRKPFQNGNILLHVTRAIDARDGLLRYTRLGRMARALGMVKGPP